MGLQTCAVTCVMHGQDGQPEAGATFEAKLNRFEIYQGYVVPEVVRGTADENGVCVLNLWPNQLGATESLYDVKMRSTSGRSLTVQAVVPSELTANLHEISLLPPFPGKLDGQVQLESAIEASQVALAARDATIVARDATLVAATEADADRVSAETAATTATTQAGISTTKAAEAAGHEAASFSSKNAAELARDQAQAAKVDAESARDAAQTAKGDAEAAAATATSQATAAGTHAANADADRIAAETARSAAETARNDALSHKGSAEAAASTATTQAGIATTKAAEASAARDEAVGATPFPSGTKMLFAQTAAPTGWTKDTTHNNKALRVVSGAAGSGGSVAFTTAFASQAVSGTVGNTTLTTAQMPSHGHRYKLSNSVGGAGFTGLETGGTNDGAFTSTVGIEATGGGGSHNHTFTGTAINLAVQYVDVIIATKD